jgi:hypothetical protein
VFYVLNVFYMLVSWRIGKNSRVAAVLALGVTAWFYHDKFTHIPAAILPGLVILILLNTVRGTFVFHKYRAEERSTLPQSAPNP